MATHEEEKAVYKSDNEGGKKGGASKFHHTRQHRGYPALQLDLKPCRQYCSERIELTVTELVVIERLPLVEKTRSLGG